MKNSSIITMKQLMESKTYIKPDNSFVEFKAPQDYLKPFLDIDAKGKPEITVSHASVNANADKSENVAYGRVMSIFRYKIDNDLSYDIGLMYALDLTRPILKAFSGTRVSVCSNLCVFNADDIVQSEILMNPKLCYDKVAKFLETKKQNLDKHIAMIDAMKKVTYNKEQLINFVGRTFNEITTQENLYHLSALTSAVKDMNDSRSMYSWENGLNAWQTYNALTNYLDKKVHFLDTPEKSFNAFKLVEEFNGKPFVK